jgi:nucleoside-diphosphate-sugar epimerase
MSKNVAVIGNGLIANRFRNFDCAEPVVLFASGVSNSLETTTGAFEREINLIKEHLCSDKLFIYFSSYSVTYKKSSYVDHKLHIENLIAQHAKKYLILRLTNVVGNAGNRNTVINFLIDKIKQQEPFNLYTHAERNFLDVDDIVQIVKELLSDPYSVNKIYNIGYPENLTMKRVLQIVEQHLAAKAVYSELYHIQEHITPDFYASGLFSGNGMDAAQYLKRILEKYYPVG